MKRYRFFVSVFLSFIFVFSSALVVLPSNSADAATFQVGDRVKVTASSGANVFASAVKGASVLGTQPLGSVGTVLAGPVSITSSNKVWQVDFDSGVDGWVREIFLTIVVVTPPPTSTAIPLMDMNSSQNYLGFSGGLYENSTNIVPTDHDAAGKAVASGIAPLDVNGNVDLSSGKIILMSIGMSNTTQEWCAQVYNPSIPCDSWTFTGQALADSRVDKSSLVILDGAKASETADSWDSISDQNYNRVRDTILSPLGYTENQVQILWVKVANPYPSVSLPNLSADAYTLETQIGNIVRAAKIRYPNLKQIFFSSRTYGGYATSLLNPEPYAYESGFAVKWLIQAQIDQMRNAGAVQDLRAGDLNYSNGTAPWIAWGPYLWANGTSSRSDGLVWNAVDFDSADYTHPSPPGSPSPNNQSGEYKVGNMLLNFFINSAPSYTPWFLATSTPPPSSKFTIGGNAQVISGPLNVRAEPTVSSTLLGTQATGVVGIVVGGPVVADGYTWWNIHYPNSPIGWSVENFLAPYTPIVSGSRVKVIYPQGLKVRNSSNQIIGTQPYGALGTATAGPVTIGQNLGWQVNFDSGVDGLVPQSGLGNP